LNLAVKREALYKIKGFHWRNPVVETARISKVEWNFVRKNRNISVTHC